MTQDFSKAVNLIMLSQSDYCEPDEKVVEGIIKQGFHAKRVFKDILGEDLRVDLGEVSFSPTDNDIIVAKKKLVTEATMLLTVNQIEYFEAFVVAQSNEGFLNNKLSSNIYNEKAPIGMKFSKSLKFFFEDREDIEFMQTKYSQIIQMLTVTGNLYISANPVDILTMSDNNYKWSSCHALRSCHRAGTLSYLLDETTAIAFIASRESNVYGQLVLDKKWRQLIYFDTTGFKAAVQSKHYPYSCANAGEAVKAGLEKILKIKLIDFGDMLPDIVEDSECSFHYNDIGARNSNEVYLAESKEYVEKLYDDPIKIGLDDSIECIQCGFEFLEESSLMTCYGCSEETEVCNCCGDSCSDDYELNGEVMCEGCFNLYAVCCDHCAEEFHANDSYWLEDERVCEDCYYESMEE